MTQDFRQPNFSKRDLELRFENNVICIYDTNKGLKQIIEFCNQLIEHPDMGHVHLEDYNILTDESKKGAIAIFEER